MEQPQQLLIKIDNKRWKSMFLVLRLHRLTAFISPKWIINCFGCKPLLASCLNLYHYVNIYFKVSLNYKIEVLNEVKQNSLKILTIKKLISNVFKENNKHFILNIALRLWHSNSNVSFQVQPSMVGLSPLPWLKRGWLPTSKWRRGIAGRIKSGCSWVHVCSPVMQRLFVETWLVNFHLSPRQIDVN